MAECLKRAAPAEVVRQVLGGDTMEAAQPFLEPSMICLDIVEVEIGRVWVRLAGCRQDMCRIPARRANATIALLPSQQNALAGVTTPSRAAAIEARFSLGNTMSVVAPWRSHVMITGICSADRLRFAALPSRLRALHGMLDRLPL